MRPAYASDPEWRIEHLQALLACARPYVWHDAQEGSPTARKLFAEIEAELAGTYLAATLPYLPPPNPATDAQRIGENVAAGNNSSEVGLPTLVARMKLPVF